MTADADRPQRRARARCRCPTTCAPRSTRSCRRAGAATTRSTSRAARRATRSPRCSSSSRVTPTSTRSCTSASASSRTRRACCATGGFYPDHGLERIVAYHERQDARFAQAAAEISDATGKPILTATELAVAAPDNPGPAAVRATGRLCYASANRAVDALGHLWRYARFRRRPRPRVARRRPGPRGRPRDRGCDVCGARRARRHAAGGRERGSGRASCVRHRSGRRAAFPACSGERSRPRSSAPTSRARSRRSRDASRSTARPDRSPTSTGPGRSPARRRRSCWSRPPRSPRSDAAHRFETRAVTDAELRDGTLAGDLTIVGGGDPVLSTSSTPSTAQAPRTSLERARRRDRRGRRAAHRRRARRRRHAATTARAAVPAWDPTDVSEGQVGALGALIVNGGRGRHRLRRRRSRARHRAGAGDDARCARRDDRERCDRPGPAAPASAREIATVVVAAAPRHRRRDARAQRQRDRGDAHPRARRAAARHDGTTAAGTRAIPEVLGRLGVPVTGVALVDGSGLSRDDRVTCAALMAAVALGAATAVRGHRRRAPGRGAVRHARRALRGHAARRAPARQDRSHHRRRRPRRLIPPTAGELRELAFRVPRQRRLLDRRRREPPRRHRRRLIGAYADRPSAPDPIPAPG